MARPSNRLWLVVLVLLVGAATFFLFFKKNTSPVIPSVQAPAPAPKPAPVKALLETEWGMSPDQVAAVMGQTLQPLENIGRFYAPSQEVQDKTKITAYEQAQFHFLDREATAIFLFFENRFFQYHIFIHDNDNEKLDSDISNYLTGQFGTLYLTNENETSRQWIWQKSDRLVNYWLYNDEMRLSQNYSAAIAVLYKPIENEIR